MFPLLSLPIETQFRIPSYLLSYFLFIFHIPWCTLPYFPSISSQASMPFLSCCYRTTIFEGKQKYLSVRAASNKIQTSVPQPRTFNLLLSVCFARVEGLVLAYACSSVRSEIPSLRLHRSVRECIFQSISCIYTDAPLKACLSSGFAHQTAIWSLKNLFVIDCISFLKAVIRIFMQTIHHVLQNNNIRG